VGEKEIATVIATVIGIIARDHTETNAIAHIDQAEDAMIPPNEGDTVTARHVVTVTDITVQALQEEQDLRDLDQEKEDRLHPLPPLLPLLPVTILMDKLHNNSLLTQCHYHMVLHLRGRVYLGYHPHIPV
jgi:hypothetical protein